MTTTDYPTALNPVYQLPAKEPKELLVCEGGGIACEKSEYLIQSNKTGWMLCPKCHKYEMENPE